MKGRIKGRNATFDDYERFFETQHLQKFSPTEVQFVNPSSGPEYCRNCYHWFINQASGWTPCEIMHLPGRKPVPGGARCKFFTSDGKHYPLLR